MITKQEILKMVRTIVRQQRKPHTPRAVDPQRDWFIILTIVLLAGTLIALWSATRFMTLDEAPAITTTASPTVPAYKKSLVDAIVNDQADRAETRSTLFVSLPTTATTSGPTATSTSTSTVSVASVFPEKLVYSSDSTQASETELRTHCAAEGGAFNTCGSVCPATADMCTEQCAFTCEFSTEIE